MKDDNGELINSGPSVIKGGYQVVNPNPPSAPQPGNWGTAMPDPNPPSAPQPGPVGPNEDK